MNWDIPLFGIQGFETLLNKIHPKGDKEPFRHPRDPFWKDTSYRSKAPNSRAFFKAVIDEVSNRAQDKKTDYQAILDCRVSETIAVFMTLKWTGELISHLRIIGVVAVNSDLEEFYLNDDSQDSGIYYRLDYSEKERGSLFDHPFPHLHLSIDGPPRIQLPFCEGVFPPVSFFEFLARNHHYDEWKKWALAQYEEKFWQNHEDKDLLTPGEMLAKFKTKDEWEEIPEIQRLTFVGNFRQAIHDELISISEKFPKVDMNFTQFNLY